MGGLLYILVTKLMEISHLLQGMTSPVIQLPVRQWQFSREEGSCKPLISNPQHQEGWIYGPKKRIWAEHPPNALYSVGILYVSALKHTTTAIPHFGRINYFTWVNFLDTEDCTFKNSLIGLFLTCIIYFLYIMQKIMGSTCSFLDDSGW